MAAAHDPAPPVTAGTAPGLLCKVADRRLLGSAWAEVLAGDREDGALSVGVTRFAEGVEDRLSRVAEDLATGDYVPDQLTPVPLVRPDGRTRLLHVPSVRDRVVERALLAVLTPIVDPWLGPFSYAYRPGLGVADAVQAVARLREEGLAWVARTDIDDCFPSVPVPRVRRLIGVLVDDPDVVELLERLLSRGARARGARAVVTGLPQGAPLSPLWVNLVLAGLDSRVAAAGFPLVRYSDDLLLVASSREEAQEAMRVVGEAAHELGLELGVGKSAVMSFAEGFTFLGEDFGPRYPPALADHRCVDPPRQVVYLGLQGSRCRLHDGRLIVETADDEELLNVPSGLVERIVVFGSVGVSAGVRSWALATGVDLVFLSRRGSYLGHAWAAAGGRRVTRLRAQLAAADDPDRAMRFARAVVTAKLRKQLVLLQRFGRRSTAEIVTHATGQINQLIGMVPDCSDRDTVMGVEGAAAREYFAALGALVPDEVRFEGRSRRPPADLINAALSYGYAILLGEATSALCAAGLDPAVGLLHAEADRRPALALDLMEEFRPMIVDQVVVAAARRSELRAGHARRENGRAGVLLTRAGKEAVVGGYERRMLQHTRGALPGFSGSLRRHVFRQAERLAAHLRGTEDWTGLSWR